MDRRRETETESGPFAGLFTLARQMETQEEDQFDVDMNIMDFLAYKATDLIFKWRSSTNPYASDLPSALATMTADFRTILKHRHHGKRLHAPAAFRTRLLQFALLLSHRLNHSQTWTTAESLEALRARNRIRASYWQEQTAHLPALGQPFDPSGEFPLSEGALAANRNALACALGQPPGRRRWVADAEGTPSVHCLLALFVELTAARVELGGWEPSERWMDLVGQTMLQAVVEEYLLNGASGEGPFNAIFAFGCPGTSRRPDDGTDVQSMRMLFCTEGSPREQRAAWSAVQQKYIAELLPQEGQPASFLHAIQRAQGRFPYVEFEDNVLSFLQHLHEGLVKPDLVQVEEGRITIHGRDLGEVGSRAMIQRIGR
ncbi:hypothetical protein P280DRAFT_309158 [Massarina eburnea CBS 473.64]|uniref:Uncharacterized protein n=1 Tax=Massarina eburnea CBS 473.64 TaxID=1395130 RepID=A0A6A6S0I3_9PLEO|nr:hypothetical protein P280DRAFT_309158 [Massarina eburnea CBS 473.64]